MFDAFFNEDHESIREIACDYAKKTLAPLGAEIDRTEQFPMELVNQMAELGFLGIKIPERYGGAGMDMRSYVLVMEEIGKKSAVATTFISSANSLSSAPILLSGTEAQKEQYLPAIASGKYIVAFGLTEPNAGSDAAALLTKAEPDGDSYILNGRKCFISHAPIATHCIIFAKTNPEKGAKGITTFLVDMKAPGVSVGKPEEKMGQRGCPVGDVILDNVRVHQSDILGNVDMGFVTAMQTLSVGRVGVAALALGLAGEALELAIRHTKTRVQFGKPLAKQQAIQFMLAEMATKLESAKLLVYHAAWLADNGKDATKEAAMAKYYATEAAKYIIDTSLQLHGGYGYSKEYEIERLYRDNRILTIYEGTTQVQQMVIAGQVLH